MKTITFEAKPIENQIADYCKPNFTYGLQFRVVGQKKNPRRSRGTPLHLDHELKRYSQSGRSTLLFGCTY